MALEFLDKTEIKTEIEKFSFNSLNVQLGDLGLKFRPTESEDDQDRKVKQVNLVSKDYEITPNFEKQYLRIAGIPYGFWKKIKNNDLKKEIFDYRKESAEVDFIPVTAKERENKLYAALRNTPITNEEIYEELTKTDVFEAFDSFQAKITDFKFDLRCFVQNNIKKISVGDLIPGIHITNSETGSRSASKVVPVIFRLACSNGLITSQRILDDGYKIPSFKTFSDLRRELPHATAACLRFANRSREQFASTKNIRIEDPEDMIKRYSKEFGIKSEGQEEVLRNFYSVNEEEYRDTIYGVINAFTAYARERKDSDYQLKIESKAFDLINKRW